MRRAAVLACAALAGCNGLLDLDEATRLDTVAPTCAAGWRYRVPIDLDNRSGRKLTDYQIPILIDTASPILGGRMRPDAYDVRITLADHETLLGHVVERDGATTETLIWTRLPFLPEGRSRIYLHHGKLDATRGRDRFDDVFLYGVIENHSFDAAGGWSVQPPQPQPSRWTIAWPVPPGIWTKDGPGVLHLGLEQDERILMNIVMSVSQEVVLPPGSSYRLRFDSRVIAISVGGSSPVVRFTVVPQEAPRLNEHWKLEAESGNITGVHIGHESEPIAAGARTLSFVVHLNELGGSYLAMQIDHLRLRRYVSPEPVVTVGAEESNCQ